MRESPYLVIYSSQLNCRMPLPEVNELATFCAQANASCGITGCLLHDGALFLQALQGNNSQVIELFDKIKRDHRHTEVRLIAHGEVSSNYFTDWHMKLSLVTNNLIQEFHENAKHSAPIDLNQLNGTSRQLMESFLNLLFKPATEAKLYFPMQTFMELNTLSDREKEVLKYVLQGGSAKEIGQLLQISNKTASRHIENIKEKMGCLSKSQLIKLLFNKGLAGVLLADKQQFPASS